MIKNWGGNTPFFIFIKTKTMTPKEKAVELLNKYFDATDRWVSSTEDIKFRVKCALIAVDEVLIYSKAHGFIGLTEYYEEVKQEIEKL